MTTTVLEAIKLRNQLEVDMFKLIGEFERSTQAQIRSVNLTHINSATLADKSPRHFVGDITIEVSL